VLPRFVPFGSVPQGSTRTATIQVSNAGDADLTITDIRIREDPSPFSVTTDRGNPPITIPAFGAPFNVYVSYTPLAGGQDTATLVIGSNDINNNPVEVPLTGGAVPRIRCEPTDALVFALPNPRPPPPAPARCQDILCRNEGYGDLTIQRYDLVGPGDDRSHPSVDDFSIAGCTAWPCTPATPIVLCPPDRPGCSSSSTNIEVCYQNNDSSTTDLADLSIESTDPTNPNFKITLTAEDEPCLFPTPVVTVETAMPTEGMEVCVNCNSSDPGGIIGMPTTITSCEWSWAFSRSNPPPTFTPPSGQRVCFTPTTAGVHILNLHVTNSCGQRSQSPGSETITVRAPM
jgi:hypothetical protein